MINKLINTEYNKKNITHTTTKNKTNKKKQTSLSLHHIIKKNTFINLF